MGNKYSDFYFDCLILAVLGFSVAVVGTSLIVFESAYNSMDEREVSEDNRASMEYWRVPVIILLLANIVLASSIGLTMPKQMLQDLNKV